MIDRISEIHFPNECPAPTRGERFSQLVAAGFISCVFTVGIVSIINPMPWSAMGQAQTQTQEVTP